MGDEGSSRPSSQVTEDIVQLRKPNRKGIGGDNLSRRGKSLGSAEVFLISCNIFKYLYQAANKKNSFVEVSI